MFKTIEVSIRSQLLQLHATDIQSDIISAIKLFEISWSPIGQGITVEFTWFKFLSQINYLESVSERVRISILSAPCAMLCTPKNSVIKPLLTVQALFKFPQSKTHISHSHNFKKSYRKA